MKDPDENIANDVDDEAGLFVVLWLVGIVSCGGYTLATLTVASMFTSQTGGQNSTSAVTDNYVDTHFGVFKFFKKIIAQPLQFYILHANR